MELTNLIIALLSSGMGGSIFAGIYHFTDLFQSAEGTFREDLLSRVHKLEGKVEKLTNEQSNLRMLVVKLWNAYQMQKERIKRLLSGYNELRQKQDLDPIDPNEIHVEIDSDPLDDIVDSAS